MYERRASPNNASLAAPCGARVGKRHRGRRSQDEPPASSGRERPKAVVSAERLRDLRFLLGFAALAGVLSVAYCFPYAEGSAVDTAFNAYIRGYAHVAGAIVSTLVDPTVRVTGHTLQGRFAIQIARDCDAMTAIILYVSGVLAFSAPWANKAIGLVAGVGLIVAANVLRLSTMYAAGMYWPSTFDFVHRELWPTLLVGVSLVGWLAWASWTRRKMDTSDAAPT